MCILITESIESKFQENDCATEKLFEEHSKWDFRNTDNISAIQRKS